MRCSFHRVQSAVRIGLILWGRDIGLFKVLLVVVRRFQQRDNLSLRDRLMNHRRPALDNCEPNRR